MLAGGRCTAASWFRYAGVKDDWDRFFDLLPTIGKNAVTLMVPLLRFTVKKFDPGEQGNWILMTDDSPTKRFGPYVEAANGQHPPQSDSWARRWRMALRAQLGLLGDGSSSR